jgi:hypothetical protein
MRKHLLLTALFCSITLLLFGQAKVTFTAQTNAKKVVKGGFFQVSFQIKNGDFDNFKPPKLDDFQIFSGPNQSSEISMINGKVSRAAKVSYGLSANKVGRFKIGSATIKIDGKTYKTKPITIVVVKGNTKEDDIDKQFIRLDVDKTEAYTGQQVIVEIKAYSLDKILNANFLEFPNIPNAYSEPLVGQNDIRNGVDVVNGKQYNTYLIQKYAVFPQRSGPLVIEPIDVYLETLNRSSGMMRRMKFNLETERIELQVKELENIPEKFSGAVGQYNFKAILNKEKFNTDETATLILNIIGTGDMKLIRPLELKGLQSMFEIYEPTIETKLAVQNDILVSQKLITYVLSPKKVGSFKFSPSFTYFDTDVNNYITLKSDTFNFTILQGEKIEEDISQDFSQQDIYPIITKQNTWSYFSRNFFGSILFWILLLLPFGSLFLLLFINKRKNNAIQKQILSKISAADEIALGRLEQAKVYLDQKNQRSFYNEINQSLFGYVSDKFSIPFSELSKDNIRLKLDQQGIEISLIDRFINILNICELALFAGIGKEEDILSTYVDAQTLITAIEMTAKNKS